MTESGSLIKMDIWCVRLEIDCMEKIITNKIRCKKCGDIIESAHPSPLSAHSGFFNSKPFSKTNDFLINHHHLPIKWIKGYKEENYND